METTTIIWVVIAFFVLIGFAVSLVNIILASLHDRTHLQQTQHLQQPDYLSTTILVPAYNEASVIERCLKSVERLDHQNVTVVVIDDASTDNTREVVEGFIKNTTLSDLQILSLPTNRGKGAALQHALSSIPYTELTMVLDADCAIHPRALSYIMMAFADPSVMGVASNVRIAEDPTILSYLQKIEFILGFRQKRSFSAANAEFIVGGQGSAYRTNAIHRAGGFQDTMQTEDIALSLSVLAAGSKDPVKSKLAFASNSLIYTEAVPSLIGLFKQRYRWKFGAIQAVLQHKQLIFAHKNTPSTLLSWYRLPQLFIGELLTFLEPFILTLLLALTALSGGMLPLLGSMISFCLYVATTLLIDEHTPVLQRFKLASMSPLIFPLFYLFSIINFIALVKVCINWKQLVGRSTAVGNWQPPSRVGKQSL